MKSYGVDMVLITTLARKWGRIHDTILFYSKTDKYRWTDEAREPYDEEYISQAYKHSDERGRYTTAPLHARGLSGGGYDFEWRGIRDLWRFSIERLDEMDVGGLIHWPERGRIPRRKVYLDEKRGIPARDLILDVGLAPKAETTGYPTQKPLALYERIIKASSNPDDLVLDPFCGCATTPVAAERLGRQWVGMDIWDGAFDIVKQRMEDNRQLLGDIPTIHYATSPPVRTDTGQEAAPTLVLKLQIPEPGPRMSHAEMKQMLIQNEGVVCKGCLRKFDDERYLDLDHNVPRSDGGINHVSNRMLLCGPCNRAKSNTLTLSGLRKLNRQNGWMAKA